MNEAMQGGQWTEARVVILDDRGCADVAVVELPDPAGPGTSFRFGGAVWRVSRSRPRTRVLVAEPER